MSGSGILKHAPLGAFQQTYSVRSYEVGRTGHIGLGMVLRYFESLATEASASAGFDFRWYEDHGAAWVVREMNVMLGVLPAIGEELRLATWISDFRRVQAQREYVIRAPHRDRLVARATARWGYIDRLRGAPRRIHDELSSGIATLGHAMPSRRAPFVDDKGDASLTSELILTARETEADSQQHINNCIYADWLSEGLHHALKRHSESPPCAARPRQHSIEYMRPAMPGDTVRVSTSVSLPSERAVMARQEVTNAADGSLYVRARSIHLRTAL